jgi:hypothetical protein
MTMPVCYFELSLFLDLILLIISIISVIYNVIILLAEG